MTRPLVSWNPANLDACALWRFFLPHLQMKNSRFTFTPGPMRMEEFAEAQIVVVQRMCARENYHALHIIKEHGMKLVYDLDDDLWSIPSYNIAKGPFERYLEGFTVCAELADLITVSTPALKSAVKTSMPSVAAKVPIEVVQNAMDFRLCRPPLTRKTSEKVVAGWAGTRTHGKLNGRGDVVGGDIKDLWDVLPETLEEEPMLYLEFVGMPPPKAIQGHPRVRVRQHVPVSEYFARFATWNWDIVLAPLEPNRFNHSKSNIKLLEAAAIGAPCLVSPTGQYAITTDLHPDLRNLRCEFPRQWKQKILELVREPDKRRWLGQRLREVCSEHFDVQKTVKTWERHFQSLLS